MTAVDQVAAVVRNAHADPWEPPLRSWLFVPATKLVRWARPAIASGADVVVVDLEDAVSPDDRPEARATIAGSRWAHVRPLLMVRVNRDSSGGLADDIAAAVAGGARGIVLPKTDDPRAVHEAVAILEGVERERSAGPLRVVPLVETAAGILAAAAIAASHARVLGLMLGGEDLAAETGATRTVNGRELLYARSHVVLAATASHVAAIDTPCTSVDDEDALETEASFARQIGFVGKAAIHPGQVAPINRIFSPSPSEIAAAEAIVKAYEVAIAEGQGTTLVDGRMVDAPVAAAAARLLDRASAFDASDRAERPVKVEDVHLAPERG